MKSLFIGLAMCCLLATHALFAQESDNKWSSSRPDGHAPIGVMGDHTHNKGEFMVSYRFMHMAMEGMRTGTDALENSEVTSAEGSNYLITPTEMPMSMHMIGGMYAVSDNLTLMAMVNILDNSMDHLMRSGMTFTTESGGLGDIRVGGLYKFLDNNRQRMHLNLGLSIPTGSIDEMDVTPASAPNEMQLPYPMQVGTGTFDLLPGITYLLQSDIGSFGAQLSGEVRLGENDRTYSQGNVGTLTSWLAYNVTNSLGASIRLTGTSRGEISGADEAYMMMVNGRMVPTVFAENFGGTQVFAGGGFNFSHHGLRIAIEANLPIVRDLNGVQMETDLTWMIGAQYAF